MEPYPEVVDSYYTISQLLEMRLPGLPQFEHGLTEWVKRVHPVNKGYGGTVNFLALPHEAQMAIFNSKDKPSEITNNEEYGGYMAVRRALRYFSTERRVKILAHILSEEEEKLQKASDDHIFWELRKK